MAHTFHKKKRRQQNTDTGLPALAYNRSLNAKDHLVNSGVFNISRPTNAFN